MAIDFRRWLGDDRRGATKEGVAIAREDFVGRCLPNHIANGAQIDGSKYAMWNTLKFHLVMHAITRIMQRNCTVTANTVITYVKIIGM